MFVPSELESKTNTDANAKRRKIQRMQNLQIPRIQGDDVITCDDM